ncbi:MAG: C4-type zinc ribbon domain-containing protein [Verrucomicrobiae bacterium]|nr:C4-type zinc ribbon domain-containing protein [Verrucomicrobiae bacterium]
MNSVLEQLLVLQDRDQQLLRLDIESKRMPREEEDLSNRLQQATATAETAKGESQRIEAERKRLEVEVESKRTQINKYKTQLLEIKNNDQFHALQHEISAAEQEIRKIEDTELDLMEQYEQAQVIVKKAREELAEQTKRIETQRQQLREKDAAIRKQVTSLQTERTQLASGIDESARSRYERIARSKNGQAIVRVTNGLCGGCHLTLTAQTIHNVRNDSELIACTNCGRILYWMPE